MPSGQLRIFGIPVRVRPEFFLMSAIFGWAGQRSGPDALLYTAIWIAIVTVSIFVHEMGHALAMRAFGFQPSIELHAMGGLTHWPEGSAPKPLQNIVVSLAGPGAGLILGGLVFLISLAIPSPRTDLVDTAVFQLLFVNVGWGLVNLVPMLPWDGGHVLRATLDLLTKGRGLRPAAAVSIALALVLLPLLLYWREFLPAYFAGLSLLTGVRIWMALRKPIGESATLESLGATLQKVGAPMLVWTALRPIGGYEAEKTSEGTLDGWRKLGTQAELLAATAPSPDDAARAREAGAWCWLIANDVQRAEALVQIIEQTHEPSALLNAVLAARRGRFEQALAGLEDSGDDPDAAARVRVAIAAARRDPDQIAGAVLDAPGATRQTYFLADLVLFHAGHYDHAARVAARAFELFADPEDAYNAACSHARAARAQEGLQWLERAVGAGYRDLAHLEADQDLASIRALPGYDALRTKLQPAT